MGGHISTLEIGHIQEQALNLIQELRDRKSTVSFAESCTGGLLSAVITEHPGVSDVFIGSVVCYANLVKQQLLGVPDRTLISHGAVSESTARAMAEGARARLNSTWAISVTGIAGPDGGTVDKPVGTVCFAVSGPNFEASLHKHFSGSRVEIQRQSVSFALGFLLETLRI